jgi:hypothetical protein
MRILVIVLLSLVWLPGYSGSGNTGIAGALQSGSNQNINLIVGFRGGINFSQPLVMNSNEVIQSPDNAPAFEKDYTPLFSNIGYQYAFVVMVYLKQSTSLSFEPSVSTYNYRYKTINGWTNGADALDYIEFSASHKNGIGYLELPVVLRHEFGGNRLIPFVSLGVFYGIRINGQKRVETTVIRNTGTVSIPYESTTSVSDNAGTYIHSRFGISPGIGVFYPMGPVKLMLGIDVGLGLNNIVNESQRYSNTTTTAGMYDIQDDIRLSSLNINIGILFNTGKNQGGKMVDCINLKSKKRKQ